jgi:hypothetical protein
MILFEALIGQSLFAVAVPESLTLLGFGIGLIGATALLRRVLKRRDERAGQKIEASGKTN